MAPERDPGGRFGETPSDLSQILDHRLPPASRRVVEAAASLSRRQRVPVHLVGGAVRDALLRRPCPDVDLVVEGDGIEFARLLASALDAPVEVHDAFLTARIATPSGGEVDVATSRREVYPAPAALPQVEAAPLAEDLRRRDYSINALAVRLGPVPGRPLFDPFGGVRDLRAGLLRALHPGSFRDDPTRILRGLGLEERVGFRFEPETERMARAAIADGAFDGLSGDRLRREMLPVLGMAAGSEGLCDRIADLGLLSVLGREVRWDAGAGRRLAAAAALLDALPPTAPGVENRDSWKITWIALAWNLERRTRAAAVERLAFGGSEAWRLTAAPERLREVLAALERTELAPHEAEEAMAELDVAELAVLAAVGGPRIASWVRREVTEFRPLALEVAGADLIRLGFAPGPRIGRALAATRAARLDGVIGADEELAFAEERLRRDDGGEPSSPAGGGE